MTRTENRRRIAARRARMIRATVARYGWARQNDGVREEVRAILQGAPVGPWAGKARV